MTITTISIGGNDYTSYASVAEADAYLAVDAVRNPTWSALDADSKGSFLVSATRLLDLLSWQGSKTGGASQENDWPRTGLTYADGTAVSTTEVPKEVENSTIITAGSMSVDPEGYAAGGSDGNTKKVKAGSTEVELFRPTQGTVLQDKSAYSLVAQWLENSAASAASGMAVYGNADGISFTNDKKFARSKGYS